MSTQGLCSCMLCKQMIIDRNGVLRNPSANERAWALSALSNTPQWFATPVMKKHEITCDAVEQANVEAT